MTLDAVWILAAVGAILALLIARDGIRERRWTLAMRARLFVIVMFIVAIAWSLWGRGV
jgi:ABC-type Fe3+ transport system permease subunit